MNDWDPETRPIRVPGRVASQYAAPPPPSRPQPPRRRSPLTIGVILFATIVVLGLAVGGAVGLVRFPAGQTASQPGATSLTPVTSPPPTQVALPPSSTPPASPIPPTASDPVSLGIPTFIAVYRGQSAVVIPQAKIDGSYVPPAGTVDPPTDNPVWIGTSSKLGTDMQTAVIAGHSEYGHAEMPFTQLGMVHPRDTIVVQLSKGSLTFTVDTVDTPDRSTLEQGFPAKAGSLKLISCVVQSSGQITKNVLVSAHLISSNASP